MTLSDVSQAIIDEVNLVAGSEDREIGVKSVDSIVPDKIAKNTYIAEVTYHDGGKCRIRVVYDERGRCLSDYDELP